MGKADINIKNFIKINTVFAQLFSQGVYGGEVAVDPNRLKEFDTVIQETVQMADGKIKSLERLRDTEKVAMLFDGKAAFQILLGIEAQFGQHYYMPVRCMELDALTYSYQCRKISEQAKESGKLGKYSDGIPKGTKIIPVVTLVFYVGKEPWDGPGSVYDMLDIPEDVKEWVKRTTPDYRMNLIDARHMSDEEIEQFEGDLKAFLIMARERYDRKELKSVVARHRETWYSISVIKNDKRYIEYIDQISDEEIAGGMHMDATLDYIEALGEVRGEAKGKKKGQKEGIDKVNRLGQLLSQDGRAEDFMKSIMDPAYQQQLFTEYGL